MSLRSPSCLLVDDMLGEDGDAVKLRARRGALCDALRAPAQLGVKHLHVSRPAGGILVIVE